MSGPIDLAALALPPELESLPLTFRDGLGERRLFIDRPSGAMVEVWRLRPELAAWHSQIAERAAQLAAFRHPRFAPVLGVLTPSSGAPVVISERVPGLRLSALPLLARERHEVVDVHAALYIVRVLVHALAALEEATGFAHGAAGLERMILTPRGRLVIVEPVVGEIFAHLGLSSAAVWRTFGVARPLAPEATGPATDLPQVGVALLSLLLGRALEPDEYPDGIAQLMLEACERTPLGRTRPLSAELSEWIETALEQAGGRRFATMGEARAAFDTVTSQPLYGATRQAFVALLERIGEAPPRTSAPRTLPVAPVEESDTAAPTPVEPVARAPVAPATAAASGPQPIGANPPASAVGPEAVAIAHGFDPTPTLEPGVGALRVEATSDAPTGLEPPQSASPSGPAIRPLVADSAVGSPRPLSPPRALALKEDSEGRRRPDRSLVEPVADAAETSLPAPALSRRRWVRAAAVVVLLAAVDGRALRLIPWSRGEVHPAQPAARPLPEARPTAPSTAGPLTVTTDPAGAEVAVDGVRRGPSPIVVRDLPPGRHTVVVESERGTVRRTVRLRAGTPADLHVSIYAGFLAVSAPIELQVLEGGEVIGTSDGPQILLPPGPHEVELVNEALAVRLQRAVEIQPGALTRLAVEPPPGVVALESTPSAEVWIDGRKVGETPLAGVAVPLGTREIVFRHPVLGERREVVTVTAAAPVRVAVSFVP